MQTLLRERTEDVLFISFTLSVDKLSAFGRHSRDLAQCIEYRLPHVYQHDLALNEHCKLFLNAFAAVVLKRANLMSFRRNYSTAL